MFLEVLHNLESENTLSNSLNKVGINLLPKPDRQTTETQAQTNILNKRGCKNPQQNACKSNSTTH